MDFQSEKMKQAAGQPEPEVEQKPKFQQKQNSGTKVLNKYKMTAERGEIEQAKKNFFRQENAQVMSIKQSLRRNGKKGTKKEKIGSVFSGSRNTPPLFTTSFLFSKHLFGCWGYGVMKKFIWFLLFMES